MNKILLVLIFLLGIFCPLSVFATAGDFSISSMGGSNTTTLGAAYPAVAYNAAEMEYLIVWEGDNTSDEEYEIWGQRIDAVTGLALGSLFRISDMGPDDDTSYEARNPAIAYNSTDNEYLVVWWGDDNAGTLINDEFEIFGQRIDASTGEAVGTNDFRISDMGPDSSNQYGAFYPKVAYNGSDNEYLVVWEADDNTNPLIVGEFEIYGQRIDASTGDELGTNDFRISDMGTDGNASYDASKPAIVYNATEEEYLVVWSGDDNSDALINDEFEIYGQRITASNGAETGTNDFRISDMGDDGDVNFTADNPAIAYDINNNQYLVVWQGDDNIEPLVDGELEIFGQRLSATGSESGANDFRISDMGPDGDTSYGASDPSVSFHSHLDEFLVAWSADDNSSDLINEEYEIFGQRINADGTDLSGDFRLSEMGTPGSASFDAFSPSVIYNTDAKQFIATWSGDDDTDEEFEIYGKIFYISASCGDNFLDAGEECDDGNNTDGDGCSVICLIETGETTDLISGDLDNTDGEVVNEETYFVIDIAVSGDLATQRDGGGDGTVGNDSEAGTGDDSGADGSDAGDAGGGSDAGAAGDDSDAAGADSGTGESSDTGSATDAESETGTDAEATSDSGSGSTTSRRSGGSGGGCSLIP